MKFLVIVLAVLSERYLIHRLSTHRFAWLPNYGQWVGKHVPEHTSSRRHSWIYLLFLVLPLVLLLQIVLNVADSLLFGALRWPVDFFIFYYCLGPNNPFYPTRETLRAEANFATAQTMSDDQRPHPNASGETCSSKDPFFPNETQASMAAYFSQVNGALFAVIFWYIVSGPAGVLFYRLIDLAKDISPGVARISVRLTALLDWLPARLTALFYLLVGNFQRGRRWMMKQFFSKPTNNARFLSQTGLLAVQTDEKDILSMPNAENLVWHAVILCLTLLAGFTLMAWL